MVTQRKWDIGGQRRFDSARLSLSMGVPGVVRAKTGRAWGWESKVQPLHAKVNASLCNPKHPSLSLDVVGGRVIFLALNSNREDGWSTNLGYTNDGTLLLQFPTRDVPHLRVRAGPQLVLHARMTFGAWALGVRHATPLSMAPFGWRTSQRAASELPAG
jgi:hypothetical protein